MKALVVGGFEPSGHDAHLVAVSECATRTGIDVESISWREMIPGVDDHLVFHLHRLEGDGPSLSALMYDPALCEHLAEDLWRRVPFLSEFDAVICVHPWSTFILARALTEQRNSSTILADCDTNFGAIPDSDVRRVDIFCGGLLRRPVRPAVWRRCVPTGVPVRDSFASASTEITPGKVCISSRRLGQATTSAIKAFDKFRSIVSPSVLYVAGAHRSEGEWRAAVGPDIDIVFVPDVDDVSPYWHGAEWVMTKGSGASAAEAFAVGAKVVGMTSGVAWEDDGLSLLAAKGALVPVDLLSQSSAFPDVAYWREFAIGASRRCVDLVAGVYAGTRSFQEVPAPLVSTVSKGAAHLPRTTQWLNEALRSWNADE